VDDLLLNFAGIVVGFSIAAAVKTSWEVQK
jgi:glycopeptide antibiotics resistance protein